MEQVSLKVYIRNEIGKQFAKKLRATGLIPAVVYRKGQDALCVKLHRRELAQVLHTKAGENVIINLKVKDNGKSSSKTVIIKEIQYHPLREDVLHVDFNQISLTELITVKVPVLGKGESIGVKEGGILDHVLHEVELECLPTEIPEKIEFDVSGLKIGDMVHIRDLSVPSDVKILNDPDSIVMSVEAPVVEVVAEELKPPEEEIAEPEVIKQKKPEEEAEGVEGESKKKEGK